MHFLWSAQQLLASQPSVHQWPILSADSKDEPSKTIILLIECLSICLGKLNDETISVWDHYKFRLPFPPLLQHPLGRNGVWFHHCFVGVDIKEV